MSVVAPTNSWDHAVVGISPQYWSYTPLSISDIHNLAVIHGIDGYSSSQNNNHNKNAPSFLPVSRCEVSGVLVSVENRSSSFGKTRLQCVLDDGTGLLDCVMWEEEANSTLFLDNNDNNNNYNHKKTSFSARFKIGDMVSIRGKLKWIAVLRGNTVESTEKQNEPEKRLALRELHVVTMVRLTDDKDANTPRHFTEEDECLHWLRSLQFARRASIASKHDTKGINNKTQQSKQERKRKFGMVDPDDNNDEGPAKYQTKPSFIERTSNSPALSSELVLQHLGPDIASSVLTGVHKLPKDYKLFGGDCVCNLPYKDELLYCHCQATAENLDSRFLFRDALLGALLERQNQQIAGKKLYFDYQSIRSDESLLEMTESCVDHHNQSRLWTNTFRALRKDGIIHLLDKEEDTYILVSRSRVLQPFVEKLLSRDAEDQLERKHLQSRRPVYLEMVPRERIFFIQNELKHKNNKNNNIHD